MPRSRDDANSGEELLFTLKLLVAGSFELDPFRDRVVLCSRRLELEPLDVDRVIAPSGFFGQHGYLPDLVDLRHNVNMHATFVAGGPDIREIHRKLRGLQAVDLAPTVADLLGIPAPSDAQGRVLAEILR
jgi:hypothetical protein